MLMKGLSLLVTIGLTIVAIGCAPSQKQVASLNEDPSLTSIKIKSPYKYPPQPVYNRLRWVNLPEPLPKVVEIGNKIAPSEQARAKLILPEVHFALNNGTLQDAAHLLGKTFGYAVIVDDEIANKPISLVAKGSISDIVEEISKLGNISVVIDYTNKIIRFSKLKSAVKKGENNSI